MCVMHGSKLVIACFVRKWAARHAKIQGRRFRDLFPVPCLREWPKDVSLEGVSTQVCLDVANWCRVSRDIELLRALVEV